MALGKISTLIILFSLAPRAFTASSKLPIFSTKQETSNVRYLTNDGKYTYYQSQSGSLFVSYNYLANEIIKLEKGTQFEIFASTDKKRIAVTADSNFHSELNLRKEKTVYVSLIGAHTLTKVGTGLNPRLHLEDSWISYYNPSTYTLTLSSLEATGNSIDLNLAAQSTPAPYFIPEVIMLKDRSILYTDVNNQGIVGVIYYDRASKTSKPIYKAKSPSTTIEICKNGPSLYLMQIEHNNKAPRSEILQLDETSFDFAKAAPIYLSKLDDFGHLDCTLSSDTLYFIQNQRGENKKDKYELVELTISTKKAKTISDLNFVSQYINLDGRLIIPYQGEFYLAKGEKNNLDDNFFEKSVEK